MQTKDWTLLRNYIPFVSHLSYELPEALANAITNEFSHARRLGDTITDVDLLRRLELARLYTKSLGKSMLDEDCWKKAVELDRLCGERVQRLVQRKQVKKNNESV